jgi:hypothetical protein
VLQQWCSRCMRFGLVDVGAGVGGDRPRGCNQSKVGSLSLLFATFMAPAEVWVRAVALTCILNMHTYGYFACGFWPGTYSAQNCSMLPSNLNADDLPLMCHLAGTRLTRFCHMASQCNALLWMYFESFSPKEKGDYLYNSRTKCSPAQWLATTVIWKCCIHARMAGRSRPPVLSISFLPSDAKLLNNAM